MPFLWLSMFLLRLKKCPVVKPQSMCSLWTAVAATMLQRLKLLKDFLGVYLNRQRGMAFLERVQASNLSDADRALVTRIIRATLKLPDASGQESSAPEAPDHTVQTSRRRHRRSA